MSKEDAPLIFVTNDDGIKSPGLLAAVRAVYDLGEVLVVAPHEQQTGMGRSMPNGSGGAIYRVDLRFGGIALEAYAVEGTPAQVVQHGVLELAPRRPALVISGINYGENLGSGATSSGTIGAALEAAAFGIPALAVSLEAGVEYHYNPSPELDFTAAAHFTKLFAQKMLNLTLPFDVDILKVEVPEDATPQTPWRLARVSRQRYFHPTLPGRERLEERRPLGYEVRVNPEELEPDSDIAILHRERLVAVSPLSLDITSRVDFKELEALLGS